MSKLTEAPTADLAAEIKRFQRLQSQANGRREFDHADDIGRQILAPLMGEMARRQAANGGEPNWKNWK